MRVSTSLRSRPTPNRRFARSSTTGSSSTAQKRAAEARKKQKTIEVKEIKMRPGIDDHDYGVKMRSIVKFLGEGDKVKVTMRFRGREMAHQGLGVQVLDRVKVELDEIGKVEQFPKMEGRQMTMVLAPR